MESNKFRIRIELPNSHRFLNVAGLGIDAILNRLDDLIPGANKVSREVQVAAQEICANVVDHAYKEGEDHIMAMEIHIDIVDPTLEIHVYDEGREFNKALVKEPALGQLQEGGFGLYFAKKLMDDVQYHREGNRNHWLLVKKLEVDTSKSELSPLI
ncbi:MAG: ATP-binding protein [Chloroflexota bacterium]